MQSELEQFLQEMGIMPVKTKEPDTTRAERLAYFAELPTTDEHGEYLF